MAFDDCLILISVLEFVKEFMHLYKINVTNAVYI